MQIRNLIISILSIICAFLIYLTYLFMSVNQQYEIYNSPIKSPCISTSTFDINYDVKIVDGNTYINLSGTNKTRCNDGSLYIITDIKNNELTWTKIFEGF